MEDNIERPRRGWEDNIKMDIKEMVGASSLDSFD
jgi:hypothetical protein